MGLYLEDYQPSGSSKLEVMKEFMKKHFSKYLVDQYYTDFFGYVTTCFLKLVHSHCTSFYLVDARACTGTKYCYSQSINRYQNVLYSGIRKQNWSETLPSTRCPQVASVTLSLKQFQNLHERCHSAVKRCPVPALFKLVSLQSLPLLSRDYPAWFQP